MNSSDVVDSPKWVRLEIVCGTLSGIFREDSRGKHELVTFYVPGFTCISLELVDDSGNREGVGLSLSDDLEKARDAAKTLSRTYGVPVIDLSLDIVSARQ